MSIYGQMPYINGVPMPNMGSFGVVNAGLLNLPYSVPMPSDSFTSSNPGADKAKGNPFFQFGKGMLTGAKNAFCGAFSWNGVASIAAAGAAVWLTGGAILPFMMVGGIAMTGYKAGKAINNGDYEKAGEAAFDLSIIGLGSMASGVASFKSAESSFALVKQSGELHARALGPWDASSANIRSIFGGKLAKVNTDGQILYNEARGLAEEKSVYQLLGDKLRGFFGKKPETVAEAPATFVADNEVPHRLAAAQQQGEILRQGISAKYTIILSGQSGKSKESKEAGTSGMRSDGSGFALN
jgi:hypothetical protein